MNEPRFSICIPAYNRPDTIRQAIQSVLNQTVHDWELLVTDDSTDQHVERVVGSFADQRIHYEHNARRLGLEGNWNAGLARARGHYVKLLMDDDYLLPTCLATQGQMLDQHLNVALVCTNYGVVDAHDQPIVIPNLGPEPYRLFSGDRIEAGTTFIVAYLLGRRRVGLPSAMLLRRSMLAEIGSVDPTAGVAADVDLWLRLCTRGDFAYCDQHLLTMRWHETNLSKVLESRPDGYLSILALYQRWLKSSLPAVRRARAPIALAAAARLLPYYRAAGGEQRRKVEHDLATLPLTRLGRLQLRWWLWRR